MKPFNPRFVKNRAGLQESNMTNRESRQSWEAQHKSTWGMNLFSIYGLPNLEVVRVLFHATKRLTLASIVLLVLTIAESILPEMSGLECDHLVAAADLAMNKHICVLRAQ